MTRLKQRQIFRGDESDLGVVVLEAPIRQFRNTFCPFRIRGINIVIPGNKKKPLHRRVGMCAKRLEVSRHIIRICAVPLFDIAGQENILKGLPKLIDVRQQVLTHHGGFRSFATA